jgi:hypothetical protein
MSSSGMIFIPSVTKNLLIGSKVIKSGHTHERDVQVVLGRTSWFSGQHRLRVHVNRTYSSFYHISFNATQVSSLETGSYMTIDVFLLKTCLSTHVVINIPASYSGDPSSDCRTAGRPT